MRIRQVTLTVQDLQAHARYYGDVLLLPVRTDDDRVVVEVGDSRVVLTRGPAFPGVHHLAFGIAPADFETARTWLRPRVSLLAPGGDDVVPGPPGWDSRSLYFTGPEDVVLELIARDAHGDEPPTGGGVPRLLHLSEVGLSVPDVPAAVRVLGDRLDLPPYPPQGPRFAPVGDADGLLVLVEDDRVWFPTEGLRAARGPVEVVLDGPAGAALALTGHATVLRCGSAPA